MQKKLITAFEKWANWKSILALFALQMIFVLVILPGATSSDTHDLPVLDLQFGYTAQRAYEIIAMYSSELLRSAAIGRLTVDMIYPLVYGLLLSFLIIISFRRAFSESKFADFVIFIPWGSVLGDYLENICFSIMYLSYPTELISFAWVASIFTVAKWILIGVSYMLVLVGAVKLAFDKNNTSGATP